jgi:Ca2+-binding EF-hand superfamily protein
MEAREIKRKALLNSLFEMWDNDGSGMLNFEEVETLMKKYKEGNEASAIDQGISKLNFHMYSMEHNIQLLFKI